MTDAQVSGSRARTRQAIVDAAIEVLGRNPAASLGDIATAADVGRTTLHRYFAERADLLAAVGTEANARLDRATAQARMAEGTGASAVHRLCQEYFDLGSLLSLIFTEPETGAGTTGGGCDPDFAAMVERGHRDGTIDPELPVDWVQSLIWSQLYAGWSYLAETDASRHEVLRLILRTVDGAIAVRPG
ncbi:TetR/AcrR family transcriptional regulator [Micromonospora peucetia]|uniref:TetR/AcrR family transcriptional regulator n=1 Tax=Micromonospora peucetia TaxID=47871 RepID=A0A1C6W6S9_9ACTN|nr:TetR/AcrR family transcriptional regulator [Micromonospora peucetia]MCX4385513.1 TetR/AcrR family transcriptional regulator [Micromonospora peucetia]WSA32905.1 TetR/AcrR family transcriptional regulator [Micromonospora peucetia]SCL73910.1 transcriptional regulator, TetR family [Micromonospora peucetia]